MGAVAALTYHLDRPDGFSGARAISPAFRRDAQLLALPPPAYEARYGGVLGMALEGQDRITADWDRLRPENLAAGTDQTRFARVPRLFIDLGVDDPFFAGASDLHLALKEAGIRHRFRVQEGGMTGPIGARR